MQKLKFVSCSPLKFALYKFWFVKLCIIIAQLFLVTTTDLKSIDNLPNNDDFEISP